MVVVSTTKYERVAKRLSQQVLDVARRLNGVTVYLLYIVYPRSRLTGRVYVSHPTILLSIQTVNQGTNGIQGVTLLTGLMRTVRNLIQ